MADEESEPSLFGWQPKPRSEGRGRPEHQATREKAIRVISLLALGRTPKEVASALGVSVPTLRKHYFSDPRIKAAKLVVEGDLMLKLAEEAGKGNVGAIKEFFKRLEKAGIRELGAEVARGANRPPKPEKLGKKAAAEQGAKNVRGRFGRRPAPPPPSLLNPSGNA